MTKKIIVLKIITIMMTTFLFTSCVKEQLELKESSELQADRNSLTISNKVLVSGEDTPSNPIGCYIQLIDNLANTTAGKDYNKCLSNLGYGKRDIGRKPNLEAPAGAPLDDFMLLREFSELTQYAGIDPNDPVNVQISKFNAYYGSAVTYFNQSYDATKDAEYNLFTTLYELKENGYFNDYYVFGGNAFYPNPRTYFLKALAYAKQSDSTLQNFFPYEWFQAGFTI
ncbi:hypothetical protein [Pedobacter miscanthi]|uniref:hypothetical protein n=1 Tax=Pedobacter miscanthi TaxID=2259170 RepID=UPI002931AAEB|nr:hypothetical protein [Pedobacter miscanthi]